MQFDLISVLLVCYGFIFCVGQELLNNGGFESGVSSWRHDGFTMEVESGEVHEGVASVKCSGRTATWQGPGQEIQPKQGGRYYFSNYVKMIDDLQNHDSQAFMVKIAFDWTDDGSTEYFQIAIRHAVTPSDDWIQMGSHFVTPNRVYSRAYLYLEGPAPEVSFYVDEMTLQEIPEDTNWENDANQRIETIRKSNIHLDFTVGSNFNPDDITVQIDHVRHLFGYGSVVDADYIVDPDYHQYQEVVYYMFNWATIQDYKWPYNRGTRDNPDFSVAVQATDILNSHGFHVRGHCMFWAVQGNEPSYVTPLTGSALKDAVDEHLTYITGVTTGKLAHWDVDNELVHGDFYEVGTGDPNFAQYLFQQVHAADPNALLFLNEYDVVAGGGSTLEYIDQIKTFKAANVGLGGVGVQSHMQGYIEPDITIIKARLDLIAQAADGLPIWVTELTLPSNENDRADWHEKLLRLYFSHPAVEGVIFWGFWDHEQNPDEALIHGYTFTPGEAGKRFLRLTKEDWSTHVNRSLSSGTSFDLRGFQGDYNVTVWYQGKPVQLSTFSLGKIDQTVSISIDGDGSEIQLPVQTDPFETTPIVHDTTSQNLQTLGQSTSTSGSQQLQCSTRWSAVSEVGDDKTADVQCSGDEILTSCSSYLKTTFRIWLADYNGFWSTEGVQAIARCCSLQGLTCTYKSAGPSGTGVDDQVVVPCAGSGYPLGCSAMTYQSDSDGANFTQDSCIAQNDDTEDGVFSHAACCQGGNIQCTTVYSAPSGQDQGDIATIQCPSGQVMTGCNVFTEYARAAGAYIEANNGVDQCVAVNGSPKYGGETGVQAIATCCHT